MIELDTSSLGCVFTRNKTTCLAQIPILNRLPDNLQRSLERKVSHFVYKQGSFIFRTGDPVRSIVIVLKGNVRLVQQEADEEEHIIELVKDGSAIWRTMFLENGTYPYTAECLTDVAVAVVRRQDLVEVIAQFPEEATELLLELSTELLSANEKSVLLSVKNPYQRLAGFLLDQDRKECGPEIRLKLDDISASIDLRPETISRNISRMEKEGLIKRTGQGRIKVVDRAGLDKAYRSEE
ncbi:MAG: Crp/Fnr family transcriptional regulator [Solobacterium sp.]|nr:Crp/Fnr family transcriptional regulator [Solobacterium sp.]